MWLKTFFLCGFQATQSYSSPMSSAIRDGSERSLPFLYIFMDLHRISIVRSISSRRYHMLHPVFRIVSKKHRQNWKICTEKQTQKIRKTAANFVDESRENVLSIGIITHLKYILSCRFAQRNNLIMPVNRLDYADFLRRLECHPCIIN